MKKKNTETWGGSQTREKKTQEDPATPPTTNPQKTKTPKTKPTTPNNAKKLLRNF